MSLVMETNVRGVRVVTLNHASRMNPFSAELENSIKAALARANADPSVTAVVVTGGPDRSFSAGGDFNEVKLMKGGEEVDRWIDRITDLYSSVLTVDKPTVAAIDGYAIGMGFQFALMFDWRQAARSAEFRMPELKHGIGCSVGAAILRHALGYSSMQEIVFACEPIDAETAMTYGIVNRLSTPEQLLLDAIARAEEMASYPQVPYRATKQTIVQSMREVLLQSADASKRVHKAAFLARSPHAHFARVLGESEVSMDAQ
ncbi:short chain enoyl-CoA hydratase [Caballeronia pedi]|uniref:Short chain enoyl-CoA hydratase n=1 Tax=Caballeronia pedi TaxID=1777141 RepID=A0A157Z7D8_9BURK|nr:enoyl-CoA hydratase/isomerase family protein [Caballeronia pedi]SAK41496.1 short chain enoyl-CoA hydratase [Caballeronia pedi]